MICNSLDITFKFSERQKDVLWEVYCCGDCRHGFLNPQPSWVELAPYYHSEYDCYSNDAGSGSFDDETVARQARTSGEFRHLKIKPGMKILDVGCGGGFFLRIAKILGASVEGLDASEHAIGKARSQGLEVFHGNLEDYHRKYPTKRFDIITSSHVLEHLPDPVGALRIMGALLVPNGIVNINVPNAECWFAGSLGSKWIGIDLARYISCSSLLEVW